MEQLRSFSLHPEDFSKSLLIISTEGECPNLWHITSEHKKALLPMFVWSALRHCTCLVHIIANMVSGREKGYDFARLHDMC